MNRDSGNSAASGLQRNAGAFFGRRKAKPLSARQQELLDQLLPRIRIDTSGNTTIDPRALFEFEPEAVRMEIGFGGGEYLVDQARRHPGTGFIGVEPFVNGMVKALSAIEEHNLGNVRVHDADATDLLERLAPGSLDRVDLLYPDPWPKKKHWKRRFVNRENLERIARALRRGGVFRFASDIEHYVNWTLQHVQQNGDLHWTAKRAADWREPWQGWLSTRYEQKAIAEGRRPAYLIFRKGDETA